MLGMSPWSPTCLAREEAATSDWAADMWMRAAELMKTALQNDDCGVATIILRERAERWKHEQGGGEPNEYDWGGRILREIEEMGGRSMAERFADRAVGRGEEEQLAAPVPRAADAQFCVVDGSEVHGRRHLADLHALMQGQRAGGGDPFMQYADLPGERGNEESLGDHRRPQ